MLLLTLLLLAQVKKKSFHKRPSGRTSINIGELKIGVEVGSQDLSSRRYDDVGCNDVGPVIECRLPAWPDWCIPLQGSCPSPCSICCQADCSIPAVPGAALCPGAPSHQGLQRAAGACQQQAPGPGECLHLQGHRGHTALGRGAAQAQVQARQRGHWPLP